MQQITQPSNRTHDKHKCANRPCWNIHSGGSYLDTGNPNLNCNIGRAHQNHQQQSSGSGEVDIYFHPEVPVISYPTPDVWTVGTHYSISPTNTGSPATGYTISPTLPAGITINPTTGVISGTPTGISAATIIRLQQRVQAAMAHAS